MYNLVKPIEVQEALQQRKIRVFTTREFAMLFGLNPYQTEYALFELVKERSLVRLKRGLYALKSNPPSDNEIANVLYRPSYISFDYALAYYGIIPEIVYQITSATTKSTRLFTTETLAFGYYTIKTQAYTGYILKEDGERRFLIAEPEKALVDYLYILTLGKRGVLGDRTVNDRLNITRLNKEKIYEYAKLFKWDKLDELIEELLGKEEVV